MSNKWANALFSMCVLVVFGGFVVWLVANDYGLWKEFFGVIAGGVLSIALLVFQAVTNEKADAARQVAEKAATESRSARETAETGAAEARASRDESRAARDEAHQARPRRQRKRVEAAKRGAQ